MRIAVTGAGGMLARAFLRDVPGHHDVYPLTHEDLDISDYHAVMRAIVPLAPEAVFNFAAFTRVDDCERVPELAYAANTLGPRNLALASRAAGAVLVQISTDYVFDGEKGAPYDELDSPDPINVYGRSKLGGEAMVGALHPEHFIVRTGYLFGGGTDHLSKAAEKLARGKPAGAIADRIATPTYVPHLAERLVPLALSGRFGTYHLAGSEVLSRFDVLTRLRFAAGYPVPVERQEVASLGLPAARPRNSALVSLFAEDAGVAPLPPLDIAIKEMLDGR